jgi:hypothetical protein
MSVFFIGKETWKAWNLTLIPLIFSSYLLSMPSYHGFGLS